MHGFSAATTEWPVQIKSLPRNNDGVPVPMSLVIQDRRLMPRAGWLTHCANHAKCWVCGRLLTRHSGFLLSIRAAVLALTEEPPAHPECAMFPLQRIRWEQGVVALWVGGNFTRQGGRPSTLGYFELGKPHSIEWYISGSEPALIADVKEAMERETALLFGSFSAQSQQAAGDIHKRVVNARGLLRRARPAHKGNIAHVYEHTVADQ